MPRLITNEIPAKDVGLPKWAKDALKKSGLKEWKDASLIRKGITPEDTKFKESERSSVDYITTKAVDRDGEIVVPSGAILDHYRNNPVVLFGHDYKSLPVGKSLWIKADEKGLISKTQYAKHKKAEDIYQYRKDGFPMAKSIGFIPLAHVDEADFDQLDLKALDLKKEDLSGASRVYTKWLMLEYSDVPVPSNPEALQLAISKNIITEKEIKLASENKAFVFNIIDAEPEDKKMLKERYGKEIVLIDEELSDAQKDVIEELKDGDEITFTGIFDPDETADVIPGETKELASPPSSSEFAKGYIHYGTPMFKEVEGISERWNRLLPKDFDVANVDVPASSKEYEIVSEWLGCKIRDVFVHKNSVPTVMMGGYLTGLNKSLSDFKLIASRNFMYDGTESPLVYSVIQLNSKQSNDFLVSGMEFYEKDGKRYIIKRRPHYFGIDLTAYSKYEDYEESIKVFSDAKIWSEENNFLKGESFSLGGEFLSKTDEDWDSLFLSSLNEKAVKRSADLINTKGKELANRGLIFMGPPGTGKTLSGRIIRNNTEVTFIWVSARDFSYSGAVGGMRYAFSLARKLTPTILFIEDIDNWLHARATDLMKTEMDGIIKSKGVITILTSNYPEQLPPALIDRPGRFHDILNFSLPGPEIRVRMLNKWAPELKEKTVDMIIKETMKFSGAHMFELISFAKTIAEEDGITMDEAMEISLNKIADQRDLIERLKKVLETDNKILKELSNDQSTMLQIGEAIEGKEGRVLSKKTRSLISDALDGMDKATSALNELIGEEDIKDSSEQDEEVVEDKVEEAVEGKQEDVIKIIEEKKEGVWNFSDEELKSAIADAITDILRDQLKVDASDIVKKRIDLAKGKVF